MDALLQFLLTSGDKFSVGGLLAAGFALTVTALYREWIVMGRPYHKCMDRVSEFETAATKRAEANEAKAEQAEATFQAFRAETERELARLNAENALLREGPGRRR